MATPLPEPALRSAATAVLHRLAPALAPPSPTGESLVRYVLSLARFGAHTDLVGARTAEALAEIALADALVLSRHPAHLGAPCWEIGAGGASLSVPLALLAPAWSSRLIEPRQKRATFLRMAIGTLDLATRLTVDQSRIEPARAPNAVAQCALSRAVFAPDTWIPLAARLVVPGGTFAVLTTEPPSIPDGLLVLATEHYELPTARARRVATWVATPT